MPESSQHLDLVQRIVDYVRIRFAGSKHLVTMHDLPGPIACDKPPVIGTFRPDVYAIDAPLTRTIIGEAKTTLDLERDHSIEQLSAFFAYLLTQPSPTMIVAVPWQAKATARSLLQMVGRRLEIRDAIELVVLDDVEVLR